VLLKIVQTGFEQRLFLIAQRIVGIQPFVAIEFCQFQADLFPFLGRELRSSSRISVLLIG